MKSRAAIKDHAIHPMLVSFPIGLFGASLVCDAIGAATGSQKLKDTGYHLMIGGLIGGLAAAVPGVIDYLTVVPPDSEAEKTAQTHALSNVGVMGLMGMNTLLRAKGAPMAVSLLLSSSALGLMTFAGWLGGNLVYRDQIGVDYLAAGGSEHLVFPTLEATPGDFVAVCGTGDLKKGQVGLVTLNHERIALAHLEDDNWAAFSDHCTHEGGPLSDGTLIGDRILCPWHGSQFNVCTGSVNCGPAEQPIQTYNLRIEGDRVLVQAPTLAPPRSFVSAGVLG